MLTNSRLAILTLLAVITPLAGCDTAEKAPNTGTVAASAPLLPPFQQEIASAKAEVTLPGVWKYGYRLVDKVDTTNGAYRAFEFHYTEAGNSRVPSRLLLVIRAYKKPAWEKIHLTQDTVARELVTHGDDVYVFSIIGTNPYPLNSPSSLRVDQMMLALTAEGSPFRMTFK